MTWVKVCGLRREAEVAAAVEAGADAVGFVLAEGSPRRLSVEQAASLMAHVPALRILVTKDWDPDAAEAAMEATGADGIQAHGDHAGAVAAAAARRGWLVLRPVSMATDPPRPDPAAIPDDQIPLLDASEGSGTAFDWARAGDIGRRFVLAGGLTPDNVAAAIATVRPWGVDASSGLEASRGVKDIGRVVAFVEEAKKA